VVQYPEGQDEIRKINTFKIENTIYPNHTGRATFIMTLKCLVNIKYTEISLKVRKYN